MKNKTIILITALCNIFICCRQKSNTEKYPCTHHPYEKLLVFHAGNTFTNCAGNMLTEEFTDLSSWNIRCSPPNQLWEPCAFDTENIQCVNGQLHLKTYSKYPGSGNEWDYYHGGQVTSKRQDFSPEMNATYSCIMKPSKEWGVVNAIFLQYIDTINLRNIDRCNLNNHEIDIEIIRYDETQLKCMFSSWTRAYHYLPGEVQPAYIDPSYDRIHCASYLLLPLSYADSFHKYSLTWSKEKIDFYIDDQLASTHSKSQDSLNVIPFHPSSLRINAWIAGWANNGNKVPAGTIGECIVDKVCITYEKP
jgi:hypothetical protein